MKTEFRSGDIQLMLDTHKRRVEYLMKEIPIEPDIARVEGTGRAHIYSYKNLLQFFIAEHMAAIGLSMKEIRFVISVIDKPSETLKAAGPLHHLFARYMPEDLDIVSTDWPLDLPKGGITLRERKYVVAIYEPDSIKKTFEKYYLPSASKNHMYLILSVPNAPLATHYWLGIAPSLASFDRDLTGPVSHYIGLIYTIIDVGRIKDMVNIKVELLESGHLEDEHALRDGYTGEILKG